MIKYVSLLRGINVSGHRIIKMDKLKEMYREMGFQNVETYIQSGNVVFQSPEKNPMKVNGIIEEFLFKALGYQVISMLRTSSELENIVKRNLFGNHIRNENLKLYVVFLKEKPSETEINSLMALNDAYDRYEINEREIYCFIDKTYQKSPFSNNFIEKVLKIPGTTRNWRTVNKLADIFMQ